MRYKGWPARTYIASVPSSSCGFHFQPPINYIHSAIASSAFLHSCCIDRSNESTEVQTIAQFTYNYTINVLSKCSNIISHRSSVFEVDTTAIDLRRSAHRSPIFEGRHIYHRSSKIDTSMVDLRRSTHRSSKIEGGNIVPTFRQFVTKYCPQRRSIVIPLLTLDDGTHAHLIIYTATAPHVHKLCIIRLFILRICASRRGN